MYYTLSVHMDRDGDMQIDWCDSEVIFSPQHPLVQLISKDTRRFLLYPLLGRQESRNWTENQVDSINDPIRANE